MRLCSLSGVMVRATVWTSPTISLDSGQAVRGLAKWSAPGVARSQRPVFWTAWPPRKHRLARDRYM